MSAAGCDTTLSSIFGPDNPGFNPMRVIANRVVREWNDRLPDVPATAEALAAQPEIGSTVLGGQSMTLRKFNVLLLPPDLGADDGGAGLAHGLSAHQLGRLLTPAE